MSIIERKIDLVSLQSWIDNIKITKLFLCVSQSQRDNLYSTMMSLTKRPNA